MWDQTTWRNSHKDLMDRTSHGQQADVAGGQPCQPGFAQTTTCLLSDTIGSLDQHHTAGYVVPMEPASGSLIPAQSGSLERGGSLVSTPRGLTGTVQRPTRVGDEQLGGEPGEPLLMMHGLGAQQTSRR